MFLIFVVHLSTQPNRSPCENIYKTCHELIAGAKVESLKDCYRLLGCNSLVISTVDFTALVLIKCLELVEI